jgi:hypothetical protein
MDSMNTEFADLKTQLADVEKSMAEYLREFGLDS